MYVIFIPTIYLFFFLIFFLPRVGMVLISRNNVTPFKKGGDPRGVWGLGRKVLLPEQRAAAPCVSASRAARPHRPVLKIRPEDGAGEERHKAQETEVDPGQKRDLHPQHVPSRSGGCFVEGGEELVWGDLEFGARWSTKEQEASVARPRPPLGLASHKGPPGQAVRRASCTQLQAFTGSDSAVLGSREFFTQKGRSPALSQLPSSIHGSTLLPPQGPEGQSAAIWSAPSTHGV